jgi:hypothetical protein
MIIAVDFDGTCVTHKFPEIGEDIGAEDGLLRLIRAGHQIILYTMRSGEKLDAAVKWFEEKGIPLYGINENPTQKSWTDSPKVYAHLYIDDAGLGTPLVHVEGDRPYVDWNKVQLLLMEKGII